MAEQEDAGNSQVLPAVPEGLLMHLSRKDYAAAIDRYHAREKARLLERYDAGARAYGPLDLSDGRDWLREMQEELDDALAYKIFEIERMERA
jgi:hypothetical protein